MLDIELSEPYSPHPQQTKKKKKCLGKKTQWLLLGGEGIMMDFPLFHGRVKGSCSDSGQTLKKLDGQYEIFALLYE